MESGIPYPRRTIRTKSHVLRSNQLPSNIPNDDEYNLSKGGRQRMALSIHG